MKFLFRIGLIVAVIIVSLTVYDGVRGSQNDIIVNNADSILNLETTLTQGLSNDLDNLAPRFSLYHANSILFTILPMLPEELELRISEIAPRNIVQNANSSLNITPSYPIELIGDNTPPQINNVTSTINAQGDVVIQWTTNENADSTTRYGNVSGVYTYTVTDLFFDYYHDLTLPDITPGLTYYFQVSSTDRSGNSTESQEYSFYLELPINGLQAINDSPTELGNTTLFTATVSNGTSIDYTWNFGDGYLGYGATVSHVYLAPGAYTAIVTATNSISQQAESSDVIITDVPIAGLTAINDGPTEIGTPTIFTATVTAGTNVIYTWDFGDGNTGYGATTSHTFLGVGEHNVAVVATNGLGSLSQTTIAIVTDIPVDGLSATNDSPTELGTITNFVSTINSGTNVIYTWNFGDGTLGSGISTTHEYSEVGVFTTIVTATNSLSVITSTTEVVITDAPIVGLNIVYDNPTKLGDTTTFIATVDGGTNVNYIWNFGDGTSSEGDTVTHTYAELGTYYVTVFATNTVSSNLREIIVKIVTFLFLPSIIR